MISPLWFVLAAFALGLLFGSFLNVCIARLPQHESLWAPRSHCMNCGKTIAWYDNVPVLSWLVLRGNCRACGKRISRWYPVVELAVGFAFVAALNGYLGSRFNAFYFPATHTEGWITDLLAAISFAILGFLLIGLLVMDWRTHTLPDAFTLPGIAIGFILVCIQAALLPSGDMDVHFDPHRSMRLSSPGSFAAKGDVFMTGTERMVLERVAAIVASACLLLLIRWLYLKLRGREGMGLGDAKLLAMIAAFLGFWPALLAFFVGVLLGSAYAVVQMIRGRASATTRLPLGTFLCIGGLLSALAGPQIIAWYTSLL